jgi:surface protein
MDKLDSIYNAIHKDLNEKNNSSNNDEDYKPYLLQPWVDSNYNTRQICLEMTQETTGDIIGCYGYYDEDAYFKTANVRHTTENIVVDHNGVNEYYKIITINGYNSPYDSLPTQVKFKNGTYIKRVVHMCDTRDITDMAEMFYGCENLTEIKDINSWNVERVYNMNSMFYNCHNLIDLDIGKWNVYKVTNMSKMFYNCKKLKTLDLTYWDIWHVQDLSYIFDGCISLTDIDLSRWCPYDLLSMTGMFQNCESLTTLDLRDFDSGASKVDYMFKGCKSLNFLNLTNWDGGTSAIETFEGCVSLELSNIKLTRADEASKLYLIESYNRTFGG